jgi:aromatic-L-amino-acid/L-tryptophan decarboxylase
LSSFSMNGGGLQSTEKPLVVYASPHAHSSVQKAAVLAGFGLENLRFIDVDPITQALRIEALEAAIAADVAAGRLPCAVVASVGTTGTTAVDPLAPIVDVAGRNGMWVHVDAALAGTAMLLPECRHLWDGVEGADSLCWNPHKWMGAAIDCSAYFVRDPQHLIRVMSTNPSYLRSAVDGEVTQFRDWGIPLGRRFRSLKLWFQLRLEGLDAIRFRLRRDLANAQWLADTVRSTPGWTVLAPVQLQTVCIRHTPLDASGAPLVEEALDSHTLAWCEAVNRSGEAYLTPSLLDGQWMVRVSIGALTTERSDVEATWSAIRRAAETRPALNTALLP